MDEVPRFLHWKSSKINIQNLAHFMIATIHCNCLAMLPKKKTKIYRGSKMIDKTQIWANAVEL